MAAPSTYLYDIEPDNYEAYAQMIMSDLDEFVYEHIQKEKNMNKRQKNLAWLLNWIGKDCYDYLKNPGTSPKKKECEDRKNFIRDQYAKKEETKPFLDTDESTEYLMDNQFNPDAAFVSRLSSTAPGELTIQYINDEKKAPFAQRFNYKTLKRSNGESIDDFLRNLLKEKNEYYQKKNPKKRDTAPIYDTTKAKNYYSESKPKKTKKIEEEEVISFEPYSTGEEDVSGKKGTYLETGDFTKRYNRASNRSMLDETFLKFK